MNRLSIKDRLIIIKQVLLLAISKDTQQVTFITQNKGYLDTHTVCAEGINPTNIVFDYFAYVAGNSNNLIDLTRRTHTLLSKTAMAYCIYNSIEQGSLLTTPEPFKTKT